jgi:hypothetical protein
MRRVAFGMGVLAGCLAACAGSVASETDGGTGRSPIVASDYDQSCTSAAECMEIRTGDPCLSCCPGAAINTKDQERYVADLMAPRCSTITGCTCVKQVILCQEGACALGGPDLGGPLDGGGE